MKKAPFVSGIVAAALLLLPVLTAIFLFESSVQALQASAADEARRILRPAGSFMARLAQPSSILWEIFFSQFPQGCPIIASGTCDIYRKKIRGLYESTLGSSSTGIRVFVLNHAGYPEEPSPEAASIAIIQAGVFKQQNRQIDRNLLPPAERELKNRFGPFITLQDYQGIGEFRLICPTAYASVTYVMRNNPMESHSVIHVEIDETVIRSERLLQICVRMAPREIGYAGVFDEDGRMTTSFAREPFSEEQSIPIPRAFEEIEASPEGFFLRRSLEGHPGKSIVLGCQAPWVATMPVEWRLGGEGWLLFCGVLFVWFGRRLDLEDRWERSSLVWRLIGSFAFASIVPFLVLTYFGALGALQARQVQEASWENHLAFTMRQFDHLFRNRVRRTQETVGKTASRLSKSLAEGKSLIDGFAPGKIYQQYAIDRHGIFAYNKYGQLKTFGSSNLPAFERLYYGLMRSSLNTMLELKGIETEKDRKSTGNDLTVMAVLGDDNPLLKVPRHPGIFHELGFAGMFLQVCQTVISAPDGTPLGALTAIFDLAYTTRVTLRRIVGIPCEPGVGYFAYLSPIQKFYPRIAAHQEGVPALARQVMQTGLPESGIINAASGTAICWVRPATTLEETVLGATIQTSRLEEAGKRDARLIGWIWVGSLALFALTIHGFRRAVLSPIKALHEGARAVGEGVFTTRLPIATDDELGELAGAFNQMTEGLQQQERMRRFISSGTWDSLDAGSGKGIEGSRRYDAAVLFSDIRGFTTISENSSPEQVIALLNDYFTTMDKIIRRNGGMIDKLIGDAIFAVFKPIPGADDPARRAVIAGLSIRAALSLFNRRRLKQGLFAIDNGVGIHYGPVTEGAIGSSQGRRDMTVMGRTVTRATLLEGVSKRGTASRVIVSAELAERLVGEYPLLPIGGYEFPLFEIDRPWVERT